MNIREAKEEIIRTVRAYQRKDETGAYEIPPEQQRPVLLMGPPGIGKTAIMKQIAEECGIGLVSYTITHHTRQSAIGLPMIAQRTFGDTACSVTDYTMSEIVASVYEQIERTGVQEGILFLDEINCVSETLVPTMLQFLQYKTFGTHRVPEGYVIVTAGNPAQYNRAAREFDIVTLDRVKRMDIEADFGAWKQYAYRAGVHSAILAYLEVKRQNFYVIRTELDGRHFVTARGWEDLSRMIFAYEKMGEEISERMVVQYLQDEEIARDFALYYALYRKYSTMYRVEEILAGTSKTDPEAIRNVPFDEKLGLIRLLADALHQSFRQFSEQTAVQNILYEQLVQIREIIQRAGSGEDNDMGVSRILSGTARKMRLELQTRKEASMISPENARNLRLACMALEELSAEVSRAENVQPEAAPGNETGNSDIGEKAAGFAYIQNWFAGREDARADQGDETGEHLTNAFAFLNRVYGTGQEMVMFLTELNEDWYCLQFVDACGNDAYERYNQLLLLRDRREQLRDEVRRIL